MFLKYFESQKTGVVIVSLGQGDLLLESMRQVCRELNIHTGVVMTGIGSLSFGRIHSVVTNVMPPTDQFFDLAGPLEVVGFRGVIASFEPHIHISLMDANCKFYGGHLEEGSKVLTLSEISILRTPDISITRKIRDHSIIPLLDWA